MAQDVHLLVDPDVLDIVMDAEMDVIVHALEDAAVVVVDVEKHVQAVEIPVPTDVIVHAVRDAPVLVLLDAPDVPEVALHAIVYAHRVPEVAQDARIVHLAIHLALLDVDLRVLVVVDAQVVVHLVLEDAIHLVLEVVKMVALEIALAVVAVIATQPVPMDV